MEAIAALVIGWAMLRPKSEAEKLADANKAAAKAQDKIEKRQAAEKKRLDYANRPDIRRRKAEENYRNNKKLAASINDPMARQMAELAAQQRYYSDLMAIIGSPQ